MHEIIPNDARFNELWGLYNTTGPDIEATKAWTITKGSSSQVIGVVDGAVQEQHDDLVGRVSGEGTTMVPDDHGTHVTGIAAARGNGGGKIAGVNWYAQVVNEPLGDVISTAQSIDDVVTAGASVINNSWGFAYESATLSNALVSAYEADVLLVHANPYKNGPAAKTSDFPNNTGPWIVNVGAMADNGDATLNTGAKDYTDVGAPGANVLSTIPLDDYSFKSGTSMAAPFVTGAASLLLAANSDLYNFDIEHVLKRTAQGSGPPSAELGQGMINAYAALQHVVSPYTITHGEASFEVFDANEEVTFTAPPSKSLASGVYIADIYKMDVSVNLDYEQAPWAWLSITAPGLSAANPNDASPYMPTSVSPASFSSSTFFYFIEKSVATGQTINEWAPYNPTMYKRNGDYLYTIIGIPDQPDPLEASVSGPTYRQIGDNTTWEAKITGGDPSYYLQWQYRLKHESCGSVLPPPEPLDSPQTSGGVGTSEVDVCEWTYGGTATTFSYSGGYDIRIRLRVTDQDGDLVTAYHDVNTAGNGSLSLAQAESEAIDEKPHSFALDGNAPNPFSSSTRIRYALPRDVHVELVVYDVLGREVARLVDQTQAAGYHQVSLDAEDLPDGAYFYRLRAGNFMQTKRMMLVP